MQSLRTYRIEQWPRTYPITDPRLKSICCESIREKMEMTRMGMEVTKDDKMAPATVSFILVLRQSTSRAGTSLL